MLEFALIAPVLMIILFGIISYALYFSAVLGVRQAAAEGARAAMAGLSTTERSTLAQARVNNVINSYSPLLKSPSSALAITAAQSGTGLFQVKVSYDMSSSAFMRYASFVPLPSKTITSTVIVTNGSY